MNVCMSLCVSVPYRSTHHSSDCYETFTSCSKHALSGFGNLKKLKTVLAGVPCVLIPGEHTFHPIAKKFSQVETMLAMVLEI